MSLKDQARSISQRLSNIAKDRNTNYLNVLTEFLIERLLARIVSDKKLQGALVFKGGFVSFRVYSSPRYTVDLDAVLQKTNLRKAIDRVIDLVQQDIGDSVWFKFEKEKSLIAQGEYGGIRLEFRAGIGAVLKNIKRAQLVNFDLGIGDPVIPMDETTEAILEKEPIHWQVYPIETIIAEKLHALIIRGSTNSRSKDLFDLYLFLPKSNSKKLQQAIEECFKYRKTELPKSFHSELKKIDLNFLSNGWSGATSTIENAPTCEEAFRKMISEIKRLL